MLLIRKQYRRLVLRDNVICCGRAAIGAAAHFMFITTSFWIGNMFVSQYLQFVDDGMDDAIIYHSKIGNLRVVSGRIVRALKENIADDLCDEDIKELVNAGFIYKSELAEEKIINSLLQERKNKVKDGSLLGGLQLSISNACNYTCDMCFVDRSDNQSTSRQQLINTTKNMSYDVASKSISEALRYVSKNGGKELIVKFFGREPLINWPTISRILENYSGEINGVSLRYDMTTNASLINDSIAEVLSKYDVHVSVSIDGLASGNDSIRKTKKKNKSSFNEIEDGIECLIKNRVNVDFSSVLSSKNYNQYNESW